jgi:hypothetical protein
VTRPHEDVDWLLPRQELQLRLAQAAELGFETFETWGESAPGEPFYLYGENGDLKLDLGVADEVDGRPYVKVHKLFFEVEGGGEAPAGYRFALPDDAFAHPSIRLEGITSSRRLAADAVPAARRNREPGLLRPSLGTTSRGTGGAERAVLPERSEDELLPIVEPL